MRSRPRRASRLLALLVLVAVLAGSAAYCAFRTRRTEAPPEQSMLSTLAALTDACHEYLSRARPLAGVSVLLLNLDQRTAYRTTLNPVAMPPALLALFNRTRAGEAAVIMLRPENATALVAYDWWLSEEETKYGRWATEYVEALLPWTRWRVLMERTDYVGVYTVLLSPKDHWDARHYELAVRSVARHYNCTPPEGSEGILIILCRRYLTDRTFLLVGFLVNVSGKVVYERHGDLVIVRAPDVKHADEVASDLIIVVGSRQAIESLNAYYEDHEGCCIVHAKAFRLMYFGLPECRKRGFPVITYLTYLEPVPTTKGGGMLSSREVNAALIVASLLVLVVYTIQGSRVKPP